MAPRPKAFNPTAASKALILAAVKKQVTPTNLLTSGKFSDLTITCQDDRHKVHKNIVCSRAGSSKATIKDGIQEPICLDNEDPEIVRRLVQYIYTGEYEPKSCLVTPSDLSNNVVFPHTCYRVLHGSSIFNAVNDQGCDQDLCAHHKCGNKCSMNCDKFICFDCFPPAYEHLLIHSKMYECAEKYDVVSLKDVSKKNFETVCSFVWDQAVFAEAATHAFYSTPDSDKGLRDIIAKIICEHPELLRKPEIQDLVKGSRGLAVGIIERKLDIGWHS